jgi:hypothetical protein
MITLRYSHFCIGYSFRGEKILQQSMIYLQALALLIFRTNGLDSFSLRA